MLDLMKGAKEYERFHLQDGPPVPHVTNLWFMKRVTWSNLFLEDGSPGEFISWWIIGNAVHWYKGTAKIDATRTHMYWDGQLDNAVWPTYVPDKNKYVVTTTEKEKFSVRFFVDPSEPTWESMGSS